MLAYVFSHRPASGADVQAYEGALRRFHAELAAGRPAGFVDSTTYRFDDGYSDWYLVENSGALDALNEAAVSGARSSSHDAAARMAGWGSGKLLSLAQGEADLNDQRREGVRQNMRENDTRMGCADAAGGGHVLHFFKRQDWPPCNTGENRCIDNGNG